MKEKQEIYLITENIFFSKVQCQQTKTNKKSTQNIKNDLIKNLKSKREKIQCIISLMSYEEFSQITYEHIITALSLDIIIDFLKKIKIYDEDQGQYLFYIIFDPKNQELDYQEKIIKDYEDHKNYDIKTIEQAFWDFISIKENNEIKEIFQKYGYGFGLYF